MRLEQQIEVNFGLIGVTCEHLATPTNDVVVVTTPSDRFALKLYNVSSRTASDVQWEIELTAHLIKGGAPVVRPVEGRPGYVQAYSVNGADRVGVLFEWAPGDKPDPSPKIYGLLGEAAAHIHRASDTFRSALHRDRYDLTTLIDEQLGLMRGHLTAAARWRSVVRLGDRLKQAVSDSSLDRGICHMDLTRDNVHYSENKLTVFDFDSAGECLRSIEPQSVLRLSADYFQAWLGGYRSVRPFSATDERAVSAFAIIGDLRVVAWDLGVARSSRGKPRLEVADLANVVDGWLSWEFDC